MMRVSNYVEVLAWYNLASLRMREKVWIEQNFVS